MSTYKREGDLLRATHGSQKSLLRNLPMLLRIIMAGLRAKEINVFLHGGEKHELGMVWMALESILLGEAN